MRYHELLEARPWRHYSGEDRGCWIRHINSDGSTGEWSEARVQFGSVSTGKRRVWVGYFVQIIEQDGPQWLAENPHSLRRALRALESKLNHDGRSLAVIGLDREWTESGLSSNSGWGYHPDFNGAVHMLDAPPQVG